MVRRQKGVAASERRQFRVGDLHVLRRRCVDQPNQNVVVSDAPPTSPQNRNRHFPSNCVFDSRNQLGDATKHLFFLAVATLLLDLASWKSS